MVNKVDPLRKVHDAKVAQGSCNFCAWHTSDVSGFEGTLFQMMIASLCERSEREYPNLEGSALGLTLA